MTGPLDRDIHSSQTLVERSHQRGEAARIAARNDQTCALMNSLSLSLAT